MTFRIGGIDLGTGRPPRQTIAEEILPERVALLGEDYRDLRPRLAVEPGAAVRAGDTLFTDRRRPELRFVAPASGRIVDISRGGRRSLEAIVVAPDDAPGRVFDVPAALSREAVTELLLASGEWQGLRTRPFDDTPVPGTVPEALFVTAMDTRPLAADPMAVIERYRDPFRTGLEALRLLSDGPTYLCHAAGAVPPQVEGVSPAAFAGPHPAGLAGTHINRLRPVGQSGAGVSRTVWHIGYQDVVAIGHLLETGTIRTRRVVSLAGDGVVAPALVETLRGCELSGLCAGRIVDGPVRVLSGSSLDGRAQPFLGRDHLQVTVTAHRHRQPAPSPGLAERLRHWLSMGGDAIIPNIAHERAAPAGILPIPFLRAISVGDIETARKLGALELAEEDMALLTYVDGGRTDYGKLLRRTLDELREA